MITTGRKRVRMWAVIGAAIGATVLAGSGIAEAVPQTLGALFEFTGTGASTGISGSIYDKDIHSGVFGLANGTLSDSYVLQGGDPFGGDTGDSYEVAQEQGHATIGGFDIYTNYDFGQPAVQVGTFITAAPDTGFLTFVNNSGSTFTGNLTLSGQAFGGIYGPPQFFSNSGAVNLANGASAQIVLNNESSNYGGYNHPDAIPEPATGALLLIGLLVLAGERWWTLRQKGLQRG
jgi:hypothetical protein